MTQAIIIIGGYNSLWSAYLGTARHLEDLTGLPAVGVPLMPWDWWMAGRARDATNILKKLEETVAWARRKFQAERFILVGHSAGGLIARLYLCDQPVWGRAYAGLEHTSAIVTLGSPHCDAKGAEIGWFLTDRANKLVPTAPYGDRILYRVVVGQYIVGREDGNYKQRRAFRRYRFFGGRGRVWGDGIVPVCCARLERAETLVIDGIAHSRKVDAKWYGGSKDTIRRWWPNEASHAD